MQIVCEFGYQLLKELNDKFSLRDLNNVFWRKEEGRSIEWSDNLQLIQLRLTSTRVKYALWAPKLKNDGKNVVLHKIDTSSHHSPRGIAIIAFIAYFLYICMQTVIIPIIFCRSYFTFDYILSISTSIELAA